MKLYKYVTAEAGIGILRQWKIRFTPPACFNDPFEMRPYFLRPEGERFKAEATEINSRGREASPFSAAHAAQRGLAISTDSPVKWPPDPADEIRRVQELYADRMRGRWQDRWNEFNSLVGVLCLTGNPKNFLMWAHYANGHRGMLIEFDPEDAFFTRRRSASDNYGFSTQSGLLDREAESRR